ncbi:MAG: carboxypeptidase-like regulatory domain-containing protein [Deltaproteobacteria bacterium]|nr:carboxypeptidase-like regulatory domain-containing protein [Deltaproteobacteria bacterium]
MPQFLDLAVPPPEVACVPKPGRACLAGRVVLSPKARDLWQRQQGTAPFAFTSLRITPHRHVMDEHKQGDEVEDDDDSDETDNRHTCACDEIYVGSDGRFELGLLPGLYDVQARTEDNAFTGVLARFEAKERASVGPVELLLNVAMHLTGVVRNPQGQPVANVRVEVQRTAPGRLQPQSIHGRTDQDGHFDFAPMEEGLYDLEFTSSRYRSASLFGVSANHSPFEVRMTRSPALLGMVAAGDQDCPPFVEVRGRLRSMRVPTETPGCTFYTQTLPPEEQLHVVATLAGRNIEQYFTVPVLGDPPVVCLGGPCPFNPAVVLVMPIGGEMDALFVDTEGSENDEELGQGMVTSGGFAPNRFYAFAGFRAGQTVRVGDPDQRHAQARVTLHTGVNELTITVPQH